MKRKSANYNLLALIFLILSIVPISGCSTIADYDQIIDQTVTSLNSDVNIFLTKMERCAGTPEGEYINNIAFYDKLNGTLDSLITRAATIPKNDIIIAPDQFFKGKCKKT